jgi:hypothetical protein
MKAILATLMILICYSSCNAQSRLMVPQEFQQEVNKFYLQSIKGVAHSKLKDALAKNSTLELSLPFSATLLENNYVGPGFYLLTPPIDPRHQFICVIDSSINIFDSKDILLDGVAISEYLQANKEVIDKNRLISFYETLFKVYARNNPNKSSLLPD